MYHNFYDKIVILNPYKMNQPNKNIYESTKLPWSSPELSELKPDLIRQQDEEILYHVLNSDEVFRLVIGSAA